MLDCEPLAKIVYWDCRSRCSEIQPQKVDREKLSHRANLYRLVNTISLLWSMLWDIGKDNLLILKRLGKSKQRKDVILKEEFICAV